MLIGIIDLEVGNLGSLQSALRNLNMNLKICKNVNDVDGCNKFILPGVGAFGDFAKEWKRMEWIQKLKNFMIKNIQF